YKLQELLQAAKSGHLAIRQIKLSREIPYFAGVGTPRPFSLVLPGLPTGDLPCKFGDMTVGIINPNCLYTYKRDANTDDVLRGEDPDELEVKLLPDLRSLWEKCQEDAEQVFWRVYDPCFTSGHLGKDGLFSLPKQKHRTSGPLPFPELVTINYDVADIKCFYVVRTPSRSIADILRTKRQCEQALGIKQSLPLVVCCKRNGSVQVCFDDELDSEDLALNEASLDEFALFHNLSHDTFRAILNLLPMPVHAEVLRSAVLTVSRDIKSKWQQAFKLVRDPCDDSYHELLE
ncbi:hypothetical protein J7438_26180, partial [Thalassotalea sp. G20_0]|uniref:hypothetical protein n=1 Tax=Thalassotalea sp. G20_0 TaxID=2821093 RepID=UPI001ADAB49A